MPDALGPSKMVGPMRSLGARNEATGGLPSPGLVVTLDEAREDAAEQMTTSDDNTKDDEARRVGIAMLSDGWATVSEIARLAGVSRQVVHYWARTAGIDVAEARDDRLAREWARRMKGKAVKPKPTKKQLRKLATGAKADWDRRKRRATDS